MELPLAKHKHFQAKNPSQACSELAKKYVEHKLCLINEDDQLKAIHNQASLPGVSLNFLEYGAEVEICAAIDDFYLIQIPLSGSNWVESDQESGLSNSEVAFISPYHRQVTQHWSADSKQIHVKIDRQLLEQELRNLIEAEISTPVNFELLMPLNNPKVASWCRFIHFLVTEFDNSQSLMTSGPSVANTVSTIITNLLYAQPHNYSAALRNYKPCAVPACIKKAQRYMLDNLATQISMDDLVSATSSNERSLFENFKKFKKMTPMSYLRMLRLEQVRKALIAPPDNACVTSIATQYGFNQLGRFAALYKQIYGELPSTTLRRAMQSS